MTLFDRSGSSNSIRRERTCTYTAPSSPPSPTCASDSQLQVAAVLGQPVGFRTGGRSHSGHGSGRSFARNLDRGPQQIDLLAVHILHVVLPDNGESEG